MLDSQFDILLNPNGIVYNPLSIANAIDRAMGLKAYTHADLVQFNELNHSWHHHGKFSAMAEEDVLTNANRMQQQLHQYLQKESTVLLTFGSAWLYEYEGEVVANCHKIPNHQFTKRLASVSEIVEAYTPLFKTLQASEVIMTVSPVRYIKDGMHQSNLSKSTLLLAVNELCAQFEHVHYFPAYEILIDELRDYRFYDTDLVHPNQQATDYIWWTFLATYGNEVTKTMVDRWNKLSQRIHHRPINSETEAYHKFVAQTELMKEKFNADFGLNI